MDNKKQSKKAPRSKNEREASQSRKDNKILKRDKDISDAALLAAVKQVRHTNKSLTTSSVSDVLNHLVESGDDHAETAKSFLSSSNAQRKSTRNKQKRKRVSKVESTSGVNPTSEQGNANVPTQGLVDRRVTRSSAGDQQRRQASDYGEIARAAASAPHGPERLEFPLRLYEVSEEDKSLQRLYFHIEHQAAIVRCLSCGGEGHMASTCTSRTCKHCGALDKHYSRACPAHSKCTRCRQRGHEGRTCFSRSVMAGGPNDLCDICGTGGHTEESCTHLWRTFLPTEADTVRISDSEMLVSCYNCGSSSHWGDDCPKLPKFLRVKNGRWDHWSAEYANLYVQGAEEATGSSHGGNGAIQKWQSGLLDDGND